MQWHAPVPLAHKMGVFDRALKFLLNLQHGAPVRRFNWTMTVDPLLDTSPENYPIWGPSKTTMTPETVGRRQHLRVELQTLHRLPRSNAIAFPIRAYLDPVRGTGDSAEMGPPPAPGGARHSGRIGHLQGFHPQQAADAGVPGSNTTTARPPVPGFWPD